MRIILNKAKHKEFGVPLSGGINNLTKVSTPNTLSSHWKFFRNILLYAVLIISLSSCARSGSVNFYVLSPLSSEKPVVQSNGSSIGIGPITIPEYLNTPQVVIKKGGNQMLPSQTDRWAEGVQAGITRVLSENLSARLKTENIKLYPWKTDEKPGYHISADILKFEGTPGGEAMLEVRWKMQPVSMSQAYLARAVFTEKVTGTTVDDLISAENKLLAKFSDEIAGIIQKTMEHVNTK